MKREENSPTLDDLKKKTEGTCSTEEGSRGHSDPCSETALVCLASGGAAKRRRHTPKAPTWQGLQTARP